MKTKKLVKAGMLLALGTILHYVVPPIFLQVKPDFLLATMFIGVMMMDDFKGAIPVIIAGGILTALTTSFPGGEIPNLVDKIISGTSVYLMHRYVFKRSCKILPLGLLGFLGTMISGSVFLSLAAVLVGLPFSLGKGILSIVVPVSVLNSVLIVLLNRITEVSEKRAAL